MDAHKSSVGFNSNSVASAITGESNMPTKQGIEAELNASEQHKANAEARATLVELDEFETMLRAAEREIWQPHWSHDDPLVDRLARIRAGRRLPRPYRALPRHAGQVDFDRVSFGR
jgi:hypothetical protein